MFEKMFEKAIKEKRSTMVCLTKMLYKSDIYIIVPRKTRSEDYQGVLLGVADDINTMSCPIIFKINKIELTMHTSCYWVLD